MWTTVAARLAGKTWMGGSEKGKGWGRDGGGTFECLEDGRLVVELVL